MLQHTALFLNEGNKHKESGVPFTAGGGGGGGGWTVLVTIPSPHPLG